MMGDTARLGLFLQFRGLALRTFMKCFLRRVFGV